MIRTIDQLDDAAGSVWPAVTRLIAQTLPPNINATPVKTTRVPCRSISGPMTKQKLAPISVAQRLRLA